MVKVKESMKCKNAVLISLWEKNITVALKNVKFGAFVCVSVYIYAYFLLIKNLIWVKAYCLEM